MTSVDAQILQGGGGQAGGAVILAPQDELGVVGGDRQGGTAHRVGAPLEDVELDDPRSGQRAPAGPPV